MRRALAGAAVGLLLIAGLLVSHLGRSEPRLSDTNEKTIDIPILLPPKAGFCLPGQPIPERSAAVAIWISTAGKRGQPVDVSVRARDGSEIARGRSPVGYVDDRVRIPLGLVEQEQFDATVCVRNSGRIRIGVMGGRPGPNEEAPRAGEVAQPQARTGGAALPQVRGAKAHQVIPRIDWLRPGSESWIELAPTIAERLPLFRSSVLGPWTLWAALGVMVALAFASVLLVAREMRP